MRNDDPARVIERNAEEKRYRFLDAEEMGRLLAALPVMHNQQTADIIRLLLLTGVRRSEVFQTRWDQHNRPMSAWVFPAAPQRRRPDRRRADLPISDIKTAWQHLCRMAQLTNLHLHDLRHAFAAYLAFSGSNLPLTGQLLGHTQAAATQRYSHLLLDPQTASHRARRGLAHQHRDRPERGRDAATEAADDAGLSAWRAPGPGRWSPTSNR
jgi:integrase